MSRELPAKPNLEHLKEQAKDLLRNLQQGDSASIERVRSHVSFSAPASVKLADAQHAIARDYGFSSWPKLKEHVDSLTRVLTPAEMLNAAVNNSDAVRTAEVLATHPELKSQLGGSLIAAVQRTDRKTIDVLLQAGADIHARSDSGMGVLDDCLPELVPFLMERGAVPDVHSAPRLGMLEKLQELVTADPAAVHARGPHGQTPLHFASTVEIAQYLLERGAAIGARDVQHESTPAQHMLRVIQARHYPRDRQDIARHLVAAGCQTDILMAAALGDLELVRRHLDADPESIRARVTGNTIYTYIFGPQRTPHMVARDFGHHDVLRLLMERTPEDLKLTQAYELGDEDTFHAWLATRPNLIATLSDEDRRRLPDSAQNNNTAAVRLLLGAGWPVDARGQYDMTPLQWAAWHGNAEMVREILRHGAQLELSCEHQITAMGSALHGSENSWHRQDGDYPATVEALLDAGAKAPKVTDDLEASEEVRDVLRRYEERAA